MKDYSLSALLGFCDNLLKDGEDKKVVWDRKTACRGIIRLLPEDLQKDVRKVNPCDAIMAYVLAKPRASEYTVREYKRRLKQTLREFITSGDAEAVQDSSTKQVGQIVKKSSSRKAAIESNMFKIVLRSDFTAELLLPHNISAEEATFLSKHLSLLAEGTSMRSCNEI